MHEHEMSKCSYESNYVQLLHLWFEKCCIPMVAVGSGSLPRLDLGVALVI